MTAAFLELVGGLDYPMVVVTTADQAGRRSGCLVGFSTQCSIEPPRLIVCLSKTNHTHEVAAGSGTIAVHFLGRGDEPLARLFGEQTGDEVDKFGRCQWSPGPNGVPVLAGGRGWVAGRVLARIDAGDHTAYLLEPVAGECRDRKRPQLGFQAVKGLDPGHEA